MTETSLADILAGRSREHRVERSPDGDFIAVFAAIEVANSQWVERLSLYRAADTELLVTVGEWCWHCDRIDWADAARPTLFLRRYPGDSPGLVLVVDLDQGEALPQDQPPVPFSGLSDWLEDWYARHRGRR